MGFPIKTACQIHLGVSTQDALSGQLLQQSREGVDSLLPVFFALHYGPLAGTRELALQEFIPACQVMLIGVVPERGHGASVMTHRHSHS